MDCIGFGTFICIRTAPSERTTTVGGLDRPHPQSTTINQSTTHPPRRRPHSTPPAPTGRPPPFAAAAAPASARARARAPPSSGAGAGAAAAAAWGWGSWWARSPVGESAACYVWNGVCDAFALVPTNAISPRQDQAPPPPRSVVRSSSARTPTPRCTLACPPSSLCAPGNQSANRPTPATPHPTHG